MNNLATVFVFLSSSIFYCEGQDWSTVPKWADFGLYGSLGFKELDFKLKFMMDNYEIISLEKCLRENGSPDHLTEQYFVNLTSQMRTARPESSAKILYYWFVN